MSEDGHLPPGVTHQMVEDYFGGQEDEGSDISVSDGRYILIRLVDQSLIIEVFDNVRDEVGVDSMVDELEFNLAEASRLAEAISERLKE